jgi:hypothetical protein
MAIKDLKLVPKLFVLDNTSGTWAGNKKTVALDRGRYALLEMDGVSYWVGEFDEMREEGDAPDPSKLKRVFRIPIAKTENLEFMTAAEGAAQRERAEKRAEARAEAARLEAARLAARAAQEAAFLQPNVAQEQALVQHGQTEQQSVAASVAAANAQQNRALQRAMEAQGQAMAAHGSK